MESWNQSSICPASFSCYRHVSTSLVFPTNYTSTSSRQNSKQKTQESIYFSTKTHAFKKISSEPLPSTQKKVSLSSLLFPQSTKKTTDHDPFSPEPKTLSASYPDHNDDDDDPLYSNKKLVTKPVLLSTTPSQVTKRYVGMITSTTIPFFRKGQPWSGYL